jgi:hypothetical protein
MLLPPSKTPKTLPMAANGCQKRVGGVAGAERNSKKRVLVRSGFLLGSFHFRSVRKRPQELPENAESQISRRFAFSAFPQRSCVNFSERRNVLGSREVFKATRGTQQVSLEPRDFVCELSKSLVTSQRRVTDPVPLDERERREKMPSCGRRIAEAPRLKFAAAMAPNVLGASGTRIRARPCHSGVRECPARRRRRSCHASALSTAACAAEAFAFHAGALLACSTT